MLKAPTAVSYCSPLILLNITSRRVTVFIRNHNEKLFCDVIKGQLRYLWCHSYRNSPKTLTLHSPQLSTYTNSTEMLLYTVQNFSTLESLFSCSFIYIQKIENIKVSKSVGLTIKLFWYRKTEIWKQRANQMRHLVFSMFVT